MRALGLASASALLLLAGCSEPQRGAKPTVSDEPRPNGGQVPTVTVGPNDATLNCTREGRFSVAFVNPGPGKARLRAQVGFIADGEQFTAEVVTPVVEGGASRTVTGSANLPATTDLTCLVLDPALAR